MKQRTIKDSLEFEGVGIHSGERVKITLHPEGENAGISFYREGVRIPVSPESVVNTFHSTDLGRDGVVVKTVEHLLATLHLLGVSNLTVEVQGGSEIPIMDGSGYFFYRELKNKVVKQSEDMDVLQIKEEVRVQKGDSYIVALPCSCFEITYEGEFQTYFGRQRYTFRGNVRDIILARTFCFEHEIEFIKKNGLGKGGSLENTLVIGREGIYNEGGLRYQDEPVRHKVFDLIGDLYLLGMSVRGKFISYKGGHSLNYELVKALYKKAVAV
ncbi:UDP-3-O-acyl-N-acetylglucosamine deacetylase [Hydrogenivirga sp.]